MIDFLCDGWHRIEYEGRLDGRDRSDARRGDPTSEQRQGGIPIAVDGQIVGAIGVSGVTSQQDAQIAQGRHR